MVQVYANCCCRSRSHGNVPGYSLRKERSGTNAPPPPLMAASTANLLVPVTLLFKRPRTVEVHRVLALRRERKTMEAFGVRGVTCMAVACFLLLAPISEAAVSCQMVVGSLSPCFAYVTGRAPAPDAACCAGAKSLYNAANSPADRKTACSCIKQLAGGIPGLNLGLATSMPGKCGLSLPFPVSQTIDCNKI